MDAARAKADAAHEELLARARRARRVGRGAVRRRREELHDANKEFIEDLDELARKQRGVRGAVDAGEREAEAAAPPRGVLVEKGLGGGGGGGGGGEGAARGFRGRVVGAGARRRPAAALPSSGKKARGDRARGAAALLFGRGAAPTQGGRVTRGGGHGEGGS